MLSKIQSHLPDHPWRNQILYFATIDSTNTHAKQLARQGAPEGTILVADHQTGGRGRLGRSFSSPAGMGLYLSLILRPCCPPEELMHLTCATGLAASDAVSDVTDRVPGIKWTNDLIWARRKLGGILTELSVDPATGLMEWAVVGIGINCCQKEQDFPPEIRHIAISLGLPPCSRPALAAALIRRLYAMRQGLFSEKHSIMAAFSQRCVTIGQDISILQGDTVRHATATGVNADGGLLVQYPDGIKDIITSGEVSIRGMYGYL